MFASALLIILSEKNLCHLPQRAVDQDTLSKNRLLKLSINRIHLRRPTRISRKVHFTRMGHIKTLEARLPHISNPHMKCHIHQLWAASLGMEVFLPMDHIPKLHSDFHHMQCSLLNWRNRLKLCHSCSLMVFKIPIKPMIVFIKRPGPLTTFHHNFYSLDSLHSRIPNQGSCLSNQQMLQ
jgi:hypothetical protein